MKQDPRNFWGNIPLEIKSTSTDEPAKPVARTGKGFSEEERIAEQYTD